MGVPFIELEKDRGGAQGSRGEAAFGEMESKSPA